MRCHYEVLGVEMDADDGILKKAYRKAALKWHPDKNGHQMDLATQRFQEIQAAFAVLSDKHERAWYDSHRDAILRGDDPRSGDVGDEDGPIEQLQLMKYFQSGCFEGYSKEKSNSFYNVYGQLFRKLGDLEFNASKEEDDDVLDELEIASEFGDESTEWDHISTFYSFWGALTSRLSFAFCDVHHLADAPNRYVRRMMEKENKKLREAAKKEYLDTVRELARHVKKLDPRVKSHHAEMKKQRLEKEAEMKRRREEERKKRAEEKRKLIEECDEEIIDEEELRRIDEEIYGNFGNSSGKKSKKGGKQKNLPVEEQPSELYCEACKKLFKSDKQWRNHERSKKHRIAVETLRAELLEAEEEALSPCLSPSLSSDEEDCDMNDVLDALDDIDLEEDGDEEAESGDEGQIESDVEELEEERDSEQDVPEDDESESDAEDSSASGDLDGEDDLLAFYSQKPTAAKAPENTTKPQSPSQKKKTKRVPKHMRQPHRMTYSDDESEEDVDPNLLGRVVDSSDEEREGVKEGEDEGNGEKERESPPRKLTAKEKRKQRQKKNAKGATSTMPNDQSSSDGLPCQICGATFPSRNALFAHIRATGHAALKRGKR